MKSDSRLWGVAADKAEALSLLEDCDAAFFSITSNEQGYYREQHSKGFIRDLVDRLDEEDNMQAVWKYERDTSMLSLTLHLNYTT